MWFVAGLILVVVVIDVLLMVSIRINRTQSEQAALDDEQAAILSRLNDGV